MTDQFIDRRNEEFAAYLQCDALLVEEVYTTSAIAVIPDPEEAQETRQTLETYKVAIKHFERFEAALEQLPDVERGVFKIQKDHWSETILDLKKGLLSSFMVSQKRKERAAGQGRTNHQANAIAEFVAQVFEKLNKPITFGISGHGEGPNTDFGKAVKKCLGIYDVRAAPIKTMHYSTSRTKPAASFELVEDGKLADWRRPAEAAFSRRKTHNPNWS